MKQNIFKFILAGLLALSISSCLTDDLEPTLTEEKDAGESIKSVDNLYAVLKGCYSTMTSSEYYGRDIIINGEVRSDNCYSNGNSGRFSTQAAMVYNQNTGFCWGVCYRAIHNANLIINTDLTTLEGNEEVGKDYQAQALAIRALAHYDLLRVYGQQHAGGNLGIPYKTVFTTSSSPEEQLFPKRNTVEEVKEMIFKDLSDAFSMISDSRRKLFISKAAVKAIEARVATYFGMYAKARAAAKFVIDSEQYKIIPASDFIKSWTGDKNVNSIFELAYSPTDNESINGLAYIYRFSKPGGGGYGDVSVLPNLKDIYEDSDIRKGVIGNETDAGDAVILANMKKYPNMNGYDNVPVIRYEEIILIYAEALLETGDPATALTYLNMLPEHRGATNYTEATMDNILQERRKELAFEGFRFDDLVRTGKAIPKVSELQNIAATVPYGDYRLAWPIPKSEMDANSNMVQNKEY